MQFFALNTLFSYPENVPLVSSGGSWSWFLVINDGGQVELFAQVFGLCTLINLWYKYFEATNQFNLVAIKKIISQTSEKKVLFISNF